MGSRSSIALTALAVAVLLLIVALVRGGGRAPGEALGPGAAGADPAAASSFAPEERPEAREAAETASAVPERAPAADGPVPERLVLTGRVVEEETRRPIPGAWVERFQRDDDERAPLRVTCAADGRFLLAGAREDVLEPRTFAADPRWRTIQLRAGADGLPARFFRFADPKPAETMELELALPRGALVRGRVLDLETRAPIEGARVRCSALLSTDETHSSADGSFELHASLDEAAPECRLVASGSGRCGVARSVALPPPEGDVVTLFLPRATWVEGRVLDAAGAPVAGAEVRVGYGQGYPGTDLGEDWNEELRARGVELEGVAGHVGLDGDDRAVASAPDGTFRSPDQVPWRGKIVVSASLPDGRAASAFVERLGAPGEPTHVELVLGRHDGLAAVRGRVTLNGEPVMRGAVGWVGETRQGRAELSEDGAFLLAGVEVGRVELWPIPHIDVLPFTWLDDERPTLELAPGEVREHDIALEHERATISGRVIHADGRPQTGVAVGARDADRNGSLARASGPDGRYVLEVPDPAATYEVVAAVGGVRVAREGVRAGSEDVDLVLPAFGLVRLKALDASTDRPLPPLFDCEWRPAGEAEYERAVPISNAPDGEGRVVVALPAGRVDLVVHAGRSGYRPARADGLEVENGGLTELTLRLVPGLSLELRLADGLDEPPAEVRLLLLEEHAAPFVERVSNGARWRGHPDLPDSALYARLLRFSDGRAVVNGLAPGRYVLRAFPDDLLLEPVAIELTPEGTGELELRWRPRAGDV